MLFLLALLGCKNSCQQLCAEIRDYASECGYEFTREDLKQCYADHRRSELAQGATASCRDVAPNVRDEWTCDDFLDYFENAPAPDDTGG